MNLKVGNLFLRASVDSLIEPLTFTNVMGLAIQALLCKLSRCKEEGMLFSR
jgi:hypothetical protein